MASMTHADIIQFIEAEALSREWSPATFCREAGGNQRIHKNLKGGGSCTIEVAQRMFDWARQNPPKNKGATV